MIRTLLALWRRRSRRCPPRPACRPRLEALEDRLAPATLPAGFTESLVASGLQSPTTMEIAPDGRIFIAEQGGRVRVVRNGTLLPAPFLTLPNVNVEGERGLVGFTLDPNFSTNGFVYAFYTVNEGARVVNRVSRFTAGGDAVVPGSERMLWVMDSGGVHLAGMLGFGSDGKLYVASGDIGNGPNAQTLANPHGKILRLNSDGSIPTDNPFYNQTTGTNRAIWALGLRNPFRFAFQPGTGRLLINDVGSDSWEEVNEGAAGANYGWPNSEGLRRPGDRAITIGTYRDPVHAYDHRLGCAITGGAFYNPATAQFPAAYVGDYFFADLCGNWIRHRDAATGAVTEFAGGVANPVDLRVGPDGALYYLARGAGGQVWKVEHPAGQSPPRTATMTFQTSPPGLRFLLDGQQRTAPLGVTGVVGITRTLGVISPQRVGDVVYEFDSWSDGGPAAHTIATPEGDTTYTAVFRVRLGDALVGRAGPTGEWWVASSTGAAFDSRAWGGWDPAVAWADVRVGRFNNDGRVDIVGRDSRTGEWWLAASSGSDFANQLWGAWSPAITWVDVRAGDFNGDGRDDLAGRDRRSGQWWLARSTGAGFVTELWGAWGRKVRWTDVVVGDFNGDGKDDLAGRNRTKGNWFVAVSNGGAFANVRWTKWSTGVRWRDVVVGDFNGDSRDDLAGRDRKKGNWRVALSSGTAFVNQPWARWARGVAWADVRAGDFDGDGRDDLAGRNSADGNWQVAVSTGTAFTSLLWGPWSPVAGWVDVRVGDFNADGRDDLAGRLAATGGWVVAVSIGSAFSHQVWGGWSPGVDWVDIHSTRLG